MTLLRYKFFFTVWHCNDLVIYEASLPGDAAMAPFWVYRKICYTRRQLVLSVAGPTIWSMSSVYVKVSRIHWWFLHYFVHSNFSSLRIFIVIEFQFGRGGRIPRSYACWYNVVYRVIREMIIFSASSCFVMLVIKTVSSRFTIKLSLFHSFLIQYLEGKMDVLSISTSVSSKGLY